MMKEDRNRVTLYIPEETMRKLRVYAIMAGKKPSTIVSELLDNYLSTRVSTPEPLSPVKGAVSEE